MPEIDNIEKAVRVRQVQEWLIAGYLYSDIVRQIVMKWTVSERTAQRYIRIAKTAFTIESGDDVAINRARSIAFLQKQKQTLKPEYVGTVEGARVMLAIERQIILLQGTEYNKTLTLQNPDGTPIVPLQIGEVNVNALPLDMAKTLWELRTLPKSDPDDTDTEDAEFTDLGETEDQL